MRNAEQVAYVYRVVAKYETETPDRESGDRQYELAVGIEAQSAGCVSEGWGDGRVLEWTFLTWKASGRAAKALSAAGCDYVYRKILDSNKVEDVWEIHGRTRTEIEAAERERYDKVWYDRHQGALEREAWEPGTVFKAAGLLEGATAAAERIETTYGKENVGPHDDFEWGMLCGELSTLRWVLGDEWGNLDS
jgi:hypothetical protein